MTFRIHLVVASAVALLAAACAGKGTESAPVLTDTLYAPDYAGGFVVLAAPTGGMVSITTTQPWQNADSADTRSITITRGEAADVPGAIHAPVRRIVAMSTTHIGFLAALGADSAIVGVSGLDYISNPAVRGRLDASADVGYEGNINYERLVALRPDLVLLYGINGPSSMERKLNELGIPYMYVGDYTEESPLGKAEWLVPLGIVVGREELAQVRFRAVADRYNALSRRMYLLDSVPKVMLNMPYNDSWFMPSVNSYVAKLISDAGGAYIYTANTGSGSVPIDIEQAYLLAEDADVWINTGAATSLADLAEAAPKFLRTKPVRTGRVFNCTKRMAPGGGNDYFESATVAPDVVLSDLAAIFHPELATDTLHYYMQLH